MIKLIYINIMLIILLALIFFLHNSNIEPNIQQKEKRFSYVKVKGIWEPFEIKEKY